MPGGYGPDAIVWRDPQITEKNYEFNMSRNDQLLGKFGAARDQFNSVYGPQGYYATDVGMGRWGTPIPTGIQRLETSQDRAMNMLKGYLDKFGSDKNSPQLTPYKIQTGPAIPQDQVQLMQNNMLSDSIAQASGVNQRMADQFASRGMGDSPLVKYLQATNESQARGEGSRAGTQLGYDAAMKNADYNLSSQKADADSWNQYQQNLIGRYQAQNQVRNAILSAIGSLG